MRILFAIIAAFTLSACAATQAPRQHDGPDAALAIAPLAYHERTLPNGLKVYAMPSDETSTVSVQVWYNVGSKDDPPGRSGFAHLFEHIMFKSTRNLVPEQIDRLTEDVGGFNNASTYDDFTNYYEVVPAHHLERLLWAESERMGALVVDEAVFQSEREVVKEEFRQNYLARPFGKLFYYLTQTGFQIHPYGRPGIGNIEELDAATVDDVRAFHAQYYRPDNAVLVVAGNFDLAQFNAWVDEYLAPIPTPDRPVPRVTAIEPMPTAERHFTVFEPNTPLPAIAISYPSPAARDPDLPALIILDGVLSTGESSRLYQSMVYDQQVAADAFTYYEATQQPSLFTLGAILSDGQSPEAGIASLDAEIARVRETPVAETELNEAKNEILAATLQGRETAYGRAFELAESILRYGDPDYADAMLAAIQAVTTEDVQRVANAWLVDDRRVVLTYLPEEMTPDTNAGDSIVASSTIQASPLIVPPDEIEIIVAAREAERMAPPEPGAPVAAQNPAPAERTLANGLRVIVAPDADLPLVSAQLRVMSGAEHELNSRGGAADLAAELMTKGTPTRTAADIAREIESLGADLSAYASADAMTLLLATRSDFLTEAFDILADVAINPVFAEEELDRQRQQALDNLSVSMREPRALANMAMGRLLFGDAPYGAVATEQSLTSITREDVAALHARAWRPDNAILVIAGDVTASEGFALAQRHFAAWRAPAVEAADAAALGEFAPTPRAIVLDLPDSGQAGVAYGLIGPARDADDYFPALVANSVLGGGFSSRLSYEIRIRRGLSYGAYSSMPARRQPAPIVAFAQTRNDAAAEVVALMNAALTNLGAEPIPDTELNARKSALIGSFARDVETTSGLAGQLAQIAAFGLPLDALDAYIPSVSAVDTQQAQSAARHYFNPSNASVVIVGDAQSFIEDLEPALPSLERIDVDEADFNTPELH